MSPSSRRSQASDAVPVSPDKEHRTFCEELASPIGLTGAALLVGPESFVYLLALPREAVVWVLAVGYLLLVVSLSMLVGNEMERRRTKPPKRDNVSGT